MLVKVFFVHWRPISFVVHPFLLTQIFQSSGIYDSEVIVDTGGGDCVRNWTCNQSKTWSGPKGAAPAALNPLRKVEVVNEALRAGIYRSRNLPIVI